MSRAEQFERIRRDHRVEGLSIRALARRHKVHRRTVRDALASAIPPPRKAVERGHGVFGPYEALVCQWLTDDLEVPKKQRHTARRVFTRLVAEHGADIAESTVRENVRRIRAEIAPAREATVPQAHEPGAEALCGIPHRPLLQPVGSRAAPGRPCGRPLRRRWPRCSAGARTPRPQGHGRHVGAGGWW